ncbi:MAG TPA: M12 family metallo-peptidase [Pyrinomonadaceae bacterium]|nr:M12 family metallo-peptidase [Pyrinomonadaceae bacterium]
MSQTAYGSLRLVVAVLVLVGCLSALAAFKVAVEAASTASPPPQQSSTETYADAPARLTTKGEQQDAGTQKIDKVLRNYDTLKFDAPDAIERVRQDGRLTLVTATETLELELEPHDLRAADYRAEESRDGGVVRALDAARAPVRTFKGIVRGKERAAARFTIDETTLEGLVLMDGEKYFVETKRRYDRSAAPTEFLFYKESDVIERAPVACDATLDEKMKQAGAVVSLQDSHVSPDAAAAAIPLNREIKLATEADYEYVAALGSSEAANNEILSILNLIEGVYQNELGLSFSVTYQHAWATTEDPYLSSSPSHGLTEFENYWNANFTHINRDTAHLWTGKDLDGNVIGSAEIGSICVSPARAYGMSQRMFETDIKVGLTAHEIGHNLGATHSDQNPSAGDCGNTIMQSQVGYSRSFCPYSRQQIAAYVENSASCLARTYAVSGQVTSEAFSSQLTLTLTGPKTRQFTISTSGNTGGFTIRGLTPGTYTVTLSGQFQNVTPPSRTITVVDGDVTGVNFASTLMRFKVGGRLTDANNVGLAGITVSISTPSALVSQTTSDAGGNYVFEVPATRDYWVTPYSPNGHFTPIDRSVNPLLSDRLDLNFVGTIRTPPPTPTPTPAPTPIKDLSGSIAFVGYDQFPLSNIYLADADGANLSSLTSDDLESGAPAWSPDGSTLAFVRNKYVYLMNADGSSVRRLTSTHEFESFPAWSPDGSKILVRKFSGYHIVSADGRTQTKLPAGGNEADWSPDGRKIVYAAGLYTANHIYVMNADGTGQTPLTSGFAAYSSPRWSPDGRKILYVGPAPGGAQISLMNPDGSNPVALTPPGANLDPAWSPDGTKIVFNRGGDIYVMRSDGSNLTRVTSGSRNDSNPTWRSDAAPRRSSFQFTAASYQAGEGEGRASVAVERIGDNVGAVSIDFSVADDPAPVSCADTVNNQGAAYARCDYATVVETLTFAPGETRKIVTIPLVDDAHVEGAETIRLRLTSPVGATLGAAASSSTLVIQDNDAGQAQNPILTTPFFVRMQYLDFLSREPEAGEPWSKVLNDCPNVNNDSRCDRILVSQSFFGSPEFRLKGFYVYAFYRLAFNRLPRYDEIIADMRRVSGATAEEVYARRAAFAVNFTLRREFRDLYGNIDDYGYVMYLMNRYNLQQITTPDPANPDGAAKVVLTRADLSSRLGANYSQPQTLSRAQVLRAIMQSDEVAAAEYNGAFVAMQYYGYLRRTPEDSGYQAWLRVINQDPNNIRIMVNGFMNSPEYRLRFGQ